ncbi:helix-turn-helix domain-containing protein [Methylobacterium sp. WL12]|uniref:helix-turn-helix domain-containing protein n=1 Tax=Methylobacterium sp. WL12 TaxID=2603890 RepID=UPI001FEEDDB0|nr:helix-turn-helix domain-containing protein [Methylobacterium sp. WL12]
MKLNRTQCVLGCVRDGSDAGSASSHLKATAEMTLTHAPKLTTDGDRSIGSRIAAYRTAQRLSQTALAQALGVTFQQVQKYEKGRNRVGAARLQAIADFLGVPVSTFFDDPAENADGKESIQNLLQDPDVMELVQTFATISDKVTRRSVLSIVKAAASLQTVSSDAQN